MQAQLDSKCDHEDLDNLPLQTGMDQEGADLMQEQIEGLKDNQIREQGQLAVLEENHEQLVNFSKKLREEIDTQNE